MDKWKKSVIHLECATDSVRHEDLPNIKEYAERLKELEDDLKSERLAIEQYHLERFHLESEFVKSRDIRFQGTAIFLQHEEKYYLLTARHVLFDSISAKHSYETEKARIIEVYNRHPNEETKFFAQNAIDSLGSRDYDKTIFHIIFRVPSLNEFVNIAGDVQCRFLMSLGAGGYNRGVYTFSDPTLDLAIISLSDSFNRLFADDLLNVGYEPIKIEDIEKSPSTEGAEVFTVGFPVSTAVIAQITTNTELNSWAADEISLPIVTFGRVSMLNEFLPFFWTDMSIYPGNSGGPIIENDKLVGIVIAQALIPIDKVNEASEDYNIRIPFGKIIKGEHVLSLIKEQQERDTPFWQRANNL